MTHDDENAGNNSTSGEAPTSVLIIAPFYEPAFRGGGPIQSIKAMISSAPASFDLKLICANHDLGLTAPLVTEPDEWRRRGPVTIRHVSHGSRSLLAAYRSADTPDVIYLNSLFSPRYAILPLALHRLGFWRHSTLALAPRGELHPGALTLKHAKKRLYLRLATLAGLHRNLIWHASTSEEADHIRSEFGPGSRVIVRENETGLPLTVARRAPRGPGNLQILFASRLDLKKGLHILLDALGQVQFSTDLHIVGAFEDSGYDRQCTKLTQRLTKGVRVHLYGALPHDEVLAQMRRVDLMVLPTAGENFGHVIAEALSQGCPVGCSANTPWTQRLRQGGGFVVTPNNAAAWAEQLEHFNSQDAEGWQQTSTRAGATYNSWRASRQDGHIFTELASLGAAGPGVASSSPY